jgi:3-hydroxyisobutyrate dehydrogenase-like beta-hydroxyacid dehydrogenase
MIAPKHRRNESGSHMGPVIGIIAQGQMGSAVGKRLTANGVDVLTVLDGRSAQSAKRAAAAAMKAVSQREFCEADIILSIVPPRDAEDLARRLATDIALARRKPIYADCNAINPQTAERIAAAIEGAGASFVDGGIIGGPPKAGCDGPAFYLSGAQANAVAVLNSFGLTCKILGGRVGAASALKMSYAGITKGLTALASIMILGASRADVAGALHDELRASQPQLMAWFERQVPSMFPKAYRWVAEMEEIAGFVEDDPAGYALFESTARFYERIAADVADANSETDLLARFFRPRA